MWHSCSWRCNDVILARRVRWHFANGGGEELQIHTETPQGFPRQVTLAIKQNNELTSSVVDVLTGDASGSLAYPGTTRESANSWLSKCHARCPLTFVHALHPMIYNAGLVLGLHPLRHGINARQEHSQLTATRTNEDSLVCSIAGSSLLNESNSAGVKLIYWTRNLSLPTTARHQRSVNTTPANELPRRTPGSNPRPHAIPPPSAVHPTVLP